MWSNIVSSVSVSEYLSLCEREVVLHEHRDLRQKRSVTE
jgi:hypothetical protein